MLMGISQVDLAILLPAFAAAWSLAGGATTFAAHQESGRSYRSPDGNFSIEVPPGWDHCTQESSNEVTFVCGKISVSVATEETEAGDTVDQLLELNKSFLRSICPVAEAWAEGRTTVAGASGAYFTMYCPAPRERTIVRIAASLIRKKFYIFKVAAPSAELFAVQATIDRMAQSFRACDGPTQSPEPCKRAC
jgi:hypothetical protein